MSESGHEPATREVALAQSGQALLLARIVASVIAFSWFAIGGGAIGSLGKFQALFAEIGMDADLPGISAMLMKFHQPAAIALPVLFLATLFFIWARGRTAAWMAGAGLLMLTVFVPLAAWAMILPLVKVLTEMSNM